MVTDDIKANLDKNVDINQFFDFNNAIVDF